MSRTLADLVSELNECRHRQQIYMELVNFLATFLDDEVQQAERSMITEGLGKVPTDLIQEAVDTINGERIDPLADTIESMQAIDVEVSDVTKPKRKKNSRKVTKGPKKINLEVSKPAGPRLLRHRGTAESS